MLLEIAAVVNYCNAVVNCSCGRILLKLAAVVVYGCGKMLLEIAAVVVYSCGEKLRNAARRLFVGARLLFFCMLYKD